MEKSTKENIKDILVYSVCGTSIGLVGVSWIVMFYQTIKNQNKNNT